jgi:hypothetical protein
MLDHAKVLGFSRTVVVAACLSVLGACTAEVETAHPVVVTDDEAAVEAETVPVADVTAYPRTEYRGHAVYFVNGRWYYPRGRRWYYYRTEPPELVRHRRYVEQAPPAPPRVYQPRPGEAVRVH